MAAPTNIVKYFDNFKGLDLRVSDLKREQGAATNVENVTKRRTGALSKRKGHQINTRTKGGLGLFNHKHVFYDGVNSTPREELLLADNELHILSDETLNITYTGSDSAYYEVYLNSADQNFYFDVYDDNVRVYNKNLGTGKETSFVSIATVVSEINALSNFTCTSSSSFTTEPAAFIPIAINVTIPTTPGLDITFQAWTTVDAPYDTAGTANYVPFSTQFTNNINNEDDILLSTAFISDCTYFTGTNAYLTKYDGNRVYKAGMDKPTVGPTNPSTAGSGTLTGDYKWKYTIEYYDAKGNVIESDSSPELSVTGLSAQDPDITIPFVLDDSGYNTDQATVSSGATSTTQTVTSGHTIKQGDVVAIKNSVTGTIERHIVNATTSTTLTLTVPPYSTLTPATNTNDIISSIVIRVWRTQAGGSLFYLVHEEVNDGTTASFTFTDDNADSALGAEYIPPVKPRGDTPFGWKYISTWRGTMILSGKESEANSVIYSDIDSPEYFPDPNNKFDVTHPRGTQIRGIRALDNILYIFLEEAIASVSGDFSTDSFVVDILSDEGVGCKSPHTIQEIGSSIWFLADSGVYSVSARGLKEESERIGPKFKLGNDFNYEQAVAFHWVDERKYVLMMPKTSTNSGNRYTTDQTEIFVYDRFWDSWDVWKDMEFTSGMVEYDNKIYFVNRELDGPTSAVRRYLKKIHNTGLTFDYADHENPISFTYKSHWETLGEPSMFKKYRRIKLFSLDASLNDFESESFEIRVQVENDYVPTAISDVTLDFGGGSTGWGSSPWGSFPWGEVRLYTLKHKLNQNRAKSSRVVMTNQQVNQNVLISGYELDVVTPYRPEIKD
jgi:hypothetical protein